MNFAPLPIPESRVVAIVIGRDEAQALPQLLLRLRQMPGVREVVFCDGGSRDGSPQAAAHAGALVVHASGGRGAQLRAGAQAATGQATSQANAPNEILWFLHADASPHKSSALAMQRATRDAHAPHAPHASHASRAHQVLGGNFRLRFGSRSPWARAFELIAWVQRGVGIYYGDSGIWVRRDIYEILGGFRPWPLFEDLDFARRLQRLARSRGARTACLRPFLVASARRFEKEPWRVLGLWLSMQRRFSRGEDPEQLAREYHRAK